MRKKFLLFLKKNVTQKSLIQLESSLPNTFASILAQVPKKEPLFLQQWMTHMRRTSLHGRHVERDNLAVCGERQFGGEDLAGHSHWAASDLEGLV